MNEWIMGGAALGMIGACWQHIRTVFDKVYSLFVVTVSLDSDELRRAVALYCWHHLWRSPFGERRYGSYYLHVRPRDRYMDVAHEKIGTDPIIFWKGWKPLLLGDVEGKRSDQENKGRLSFLRGTWDADQLICNAMELYNDRVASAQAEDAEALATGRFAVYQMFGDADSPFRSSGTTLRRRRGDGESWTEEFRLGDTRIIGYHPEDLGPKRFRATDPTTRLAFSPHIWGHVAEIRQWLENRSWYNSRDIPWKRGWVLHGVPGNGKTSLVRALAEMHDLPIYVYSLGTFGDEQFREAWRFMVARTPCVALIEDIDNIFHGRTNIQKGEIASRLSYDCLLNTLDGLESNDGVFTIITTNHIEHLDPALGSPVGGDASSRPGRIDRVIEIGNPDEHCRRHIAERILCDTPWLIDITVMAGERDSAAQFQERCVHIALEEFWQHPLRSQDEDSPTATPATGVIDSMKDALFSANTVEA